MRLVRLLPGWLTMPFVAGFVVMACAAPAAAPAEKPAAPAPAAAPAVAKPVEKAVPAPAKVEQKPAAPAAAKPAEKAAPAKAVGSVILGVGIDAAYASLIAGAKKGLFQKHGVDASVRVFPSGQESLEAVLTGQADTTGNGQYNIPLVAAKGGKIKIIAEYERSDQQFGVAAKSTIKTPKDLEGKKVGTQFNTSPEYYYRLYVQKYGLDESKIAFQNIAFAQLVPALAKGDIDAFFAFEPHLTRAVEAAPGTHILHRSGQDGVMPLRVYLGVSEKVYTNKDLAVAMLKGIVEAGDWSNSNREEVAKILADEYKMKPEDAKRYVGYFDYSARFDKASLDELDRVNKFLADKKIVPQAPDLSKFVTTEFMKEAAPARTQ